MRPEQRAGCTAVAAEAPRSWPRVLVDPVFGRYMTATFLTMLGIWIYNIVAVVVAYDATGSALVAGAVTAAQFLPHLLIAPLAGAAADRWDRKAQAAAGHVVVAVGAGALAVWLALGDPGSTPAWPLIASSAVVGIGSSVAAPANLALVPALVRPAELHTAVTISMAPLPVGRALGPVIGTTLAALAHPALAFAATAAASVVFVVLVLGLRPRPARVLDADTNQGAWRYLWQHRPLVVLLACVAMVGGGTDPALTLAPAISADLTGGTSMAGTIATAFGVGAGLGFVLVPPARRALGTRYGYTGLFVMAVGTALPAVGTTATVLGGFVVAGAGLTLAMTGFSWTLQTALPDDIRGRVMALWTLAFAGSRPLAATLNGAVADHVSLTAALLVMASLATATGLWGLSRGAGSVDRGEAG